MDLVFITEATSQPWAWSLEAIGTIGAAVVALAIASREVGIRWAEQRARARLAKIMLWPELRRYLMALNRLRSHMAPASFDEYLDRNLALQPMLGTLSSDHELVLGLVRDLAGSESDSMGRVLSNVRHVVRHLVDIEVLKAQGLTERQYRAKRQAILTSIAAARRDLIPLLRQSKALMNAR